MKLAKPSLLAVVINALLMQLLWFVAVIGGAHGWGVMAVMPLVVMVIAGPCTGGRIKPDLVLLAAAVVMGLVFEVALQSAGLIAYRGNAGGILPPLWILLLWAGMGASCNYSFTWLQRHLWLAAVLGAIGSVLSLRAGMALGAAVAPVGWLPLALVYGAAWALILPLLVYLSREVSRDHDFVV